MRHSALARLQQAMVLAALVFAMVWAVVWWSRSPLVALVGAALALGGYAVVLAFEGVMSTWVNRGDPTPRLSFGGAVGAWWQEVRMGLKVFAWRQPFRWANLPDDVVRPATSASPAVVFVHGFVCNRGFWLPWMRRLRAQGIPYTSVNLEPVFGDIDDYLPLMSDAVRRAHALTGRPPLLVCHSMGGLVARAWAAMEPEVPVLGMVTIGSPHRGTWLGRFSRVANGRQMRVGGDWLGALFAREAQIRPTQTYGHFLCWYSNGDSIVFPASTATLPGADNRHVPGVPHVALAFHPRVMDESLAVLASGVRSPSERTAS
ncbi:esterase/lipase family protein [Hydrogenophaga sp. BPS33]|uniref:esterase/lipase family protein n=1 Tax=Hydrogenophaga sp. BPS33 TaxID=2651974 RepID=UPI00132012E5|nr:alpha/beta fold hydrolase [Hydrogenophaga sp. BPS33]QHE84067.1 alpha/beta fold hydrolase [Hydrogenophaga sp. BPS33]